jgi:hypothetical protein
MVTNGKLLGFFTATREVFNDAELELNLNEEVDSYFFHILNTS